MLKDRETVKAEEKAFQKYIDKCKKFYCKKYNLNFVNTYERLFSFINSKILSEINLSKRKKTYSDDVKVDIEKYYPQIYQILSTELLKKMKQSNNTQSVGKFDENELFKNFNNNKILDAALKANRSDMIDMKTKVYDFDPILKEKILDKKRKEKFDREIKEIFQRQCGKSKDNSIKHFKVKDKKDFGTGKESYSKIAYLASLNFNFMSPID